MQHRLGNMLPQKIKGKSLPLGNMLPGVCPAYPAPRPALTSDYTCSSRHVTLSRDPHQVSRCEESESHK